MKIGILTFHWATNYGAILQAFCLQNYLSELGHDVEIINYKPQKFDFSWKGYIFNPMKLLSIIRDLSNKKKELLLSPFREKYLNLTERYSKVIDIENRASRYDILISGSDQILNPWFTMNGEDGKPSSAYYLKFGDSSIKRIGYSVSFGYDIYPEFARETASRWINSFDVIGCRENTGLSVLKQLSYNKTSCLTPDPTLLLGNRIFNLLGLTIPAQKENYICVYALRRVIAVPGEVKIIDELHNPLTMEEWIITIARSRAIITNSYHGMIIAILAHVPFAVLLESGGLNGMNDRFATLLGYLNCQNRMCSEVNEAFNILDNPIDFSEIDRKLESFKEEGEIFISENIKI